MTSENVKQAYSKNYAGGENTETLYVNSPKKKKSSVREILKEGSIPKQWKNVLKALTELEEGWDCYDGGPISQKIVDNAERVLIELHKNKVPQPDITPDGDDTLLLEFDKFDLEVYIEKSDSILVTHRGKDTVLKDYSKLKSYLEA